MTTANRPDVRVGPRIEQRRAPRPNSARASARPMTTVDLASGRSIAVVRPAMPRLLRVFLALTGVKV